MLEEAKLELIGAYDNYTKQGVNEQTERITYVVKRKQRLNLSINERKNNDE